MKNNRIVSFVLAVVMLFSVCAIFSSCGKKVNKGVLLSTFIDGEIYESDILDWQNYLISLNQEKLLSFKQDQGEERALFIASIYDEALRYWTQVLVMRKALAKAGYTFTDEDIKKTAKATIEEWNEDYKSVGGWKAIQEKLEISDNFITQYAISDLVQSYLQRFCLERYPITDEMIQNYYANHTEQYLVAPSFRLDMIYVTVAQADLGNEDAWKAAKAEALSYLERIKNGEDFQTVKADAVKNAKDKKVAEAFSTASEINKSSCAQYADLAATLKTIDEQYDKYCKDNKVKFVKYANPKGDKNEYNVWFNYANAVNQVTVKNALLTMEDGELYDGVIEHVYGYEIIFKESTSSETYFKDLSDDGVYEEIYEAVKKELWNGGAGIAVSETLKAVEKEYNVKYLFSYEEFTQKQIDSNAESKPTSTTASTTAASTTAKQN